jgi:hypothetical protein
MKPRARFAVLLLMSFVAPACGSTSTATSPTTTVVSPATETFASTLTELGTATRSFVASKSGTVTVTLTSVTPSVVVGLALGIANSNGTGCSLSMSKNTLPGSVPQFTTAVDAGDYCVTIYDVGNLTGQVRFSVTLVHP